MDEERREFQKVHPQGPLENMIEVSGPQTEMKFSYCTPRKPNTCWLNFINLKLAPGAFRSSSLSLSAPGRNKGALACASFCWRARSPGEKRAPSKTQAFILHPLFCYGWVYHSLSVCGGRLLFPLFFLFALTFSAEDPPMSPQESLRAVPLCWTKILNVEHYSTFCV